MRKLIPLELEFMTEQGRCPFCGSRGFIEGPSGGMSQNIYCGNDDCEARFNIMGPLGVDLIQDSKIDPNHWEAYRHQTQPKPEPKFSKDQILAKFGVGKRHWWQRA